ncbi:hypothetical protein CJU89_1070 [Yarrowia sp. B02]|nr:hypothetical protein CJU89_1070 [Yarrowia sp. B02]
MSFILDQLNETTLNVQGDEGVQFSLVGGLGTLASAYASYLMCTRVPSSNKTWLAATVASLFISIGNQYQCQFTPGSPANSSYIGRLPWTVLRVVFLAIVYGQLNLGNTKFTWAAGNPLHIPALFLASYVLNEVGNALRKPLPKPVVKDE